MRIIRRVLMWVGGTLVLILLLVYICLHVLMFQSYEARMSGKYARALNRAFLASDLVQILYPAGSTTWQNIILYTANLAGEMGPVGVFDVDRSHNKGVDLILDSVQSHGSLAPQVAAQMLLEASRIANSNMQIGMAGTLATKGEMFLQSARPEEIELLSANLQIERSFSELMGMGLSPTVENPKDSWEDVVTPDYKKAASVVCARDKIRCAFNSVRWNIGRCMREESSSEISSCLSRAYPAITDMSAICHGLTVEQCHSIIGMLQPHYFYLLRTEGANHHGSEASYGAGVNYFSAPASTHQFNPLRH